MIDSFFVGLFLSSFLGALIGTQREMKQQKTHVLDFAGFRAFTFISVFGFLLGYISLEIFISYVLIFIGFFGVFILSISAYIINFSKFKNMNSITGQISFLLTFLSGIFVSLELYYYAIVLSIFIATVLFLGFKLHSFAKHLNNNELFATLKFAIISLVILPILPNEEFGFLDVPFLNDFLLLFFSFDFLDNFRIFNFYHIWLMVVLISGLSYLGYVLMKSLGTKKGIMITSFLGGFMSSTALTSSFSIESKRLKNLTNPLAFGVIFASSIMFFRVIFEVAIINPLILNKVIFLSIMGFLGIILGLMFYSKSELSMSQNIKMNSPFMIGPALKFGGFFILIIFFSKLFSLYFGNNGVYLIAFISGFIDVDVITITLSKLALEGTISEFGAAFGIFLATISNTFFKGSIAYFLGSRSFSKLVIKNFLIIIGVGILSLILFSGFFN